MSRLITLPTYEWHDVNAPTQQWTDPPRRRCTLCGGDGLHCNVVDCPAQFGRRAPAFCLRSFLWGIGLASMVGLVVTVTVGEWLLTAMGGGK